MHKINKFIGILIFNIVIIIILEIVKDYLEIQTARAKEGVYENDKLMLFISAVLFAPIVEEFAYRYQFVKGRFIYFAIVWGCLFGFINEDYPIIITITIIINIISFIIYFFFKKDKLPMFLIISYTILFGVSHVVNYEVSELSELPRYLYVIQFFPQILLGLCLVYVRINYQFRYSILYHSAYNFIIILLYLFF